MPFVNPFFGVVDGDPMVAADVDAALTAARDYVNEGVAVATDIVNDSIVPSDIYKPETYGYPVEGTVGTMQQAYKAEAGNAARLAPVFFQWPVVVPWCYAWQGLTAPHRTSILPQLLQPYQLAVVPGLTRRVYVEGNSLVQLFASLSHIQLCSMIGNATLLNDPTGLTPDDPTTVSEPTAVYPGVGVGDRAGSFVLAYKNVNETEWTQLDDTRRYVYPQEERINWHDPLNVHPPSITADYPHVPLSDFRPYGDNNNSAVCYMPVCHTEMCDTFNLTLPTGAPGWFDFCVLFHKGGVAALGSEPTLEILQIVVGVRNLVIETFVNSA